MSDATNLTEPEVNTFWHERAEKRWHRVVRVVAIYPSSIGVMTAFVDGKPWAGAKRESQVSRARFPKAYVQVPDPSEADHSPTTEELIAAAHDYLLRSTGETPAAFHGRITKNIVAGVYALPELSSQGLMGLLVFALEAAASRLQALEAENATRNGMAAAGESLMSAIEANSNHPSLKDWAPAECPSEIVGDLLEEIDVLTARLARVEGQQSVVREIAAERQRQVDVEGWTPEHDDEHVNGELAFAAACYARLAGDEGRTNGLAHTSIRHIVPGSWPWADEWWKPKGPRRDLLRAAALIVAEIERLDRHAALSPEQKEGA
jgi:hypothetical protein